MSLTSPRGDKNRPEHQITIVLNNEKISEPLQVEIEVRQLQLLVG